MVRARVCQYEPGLLQERHSHEEACVSLLLAGSLRETVRGSEETAHACSLVTKPSGVEHANIFGPSGAVLLQIVMRGELPGACAPTWGWRWHHHDAPLREFTALLDAVARTAPAHAIERRSIEALASLPAATEQGSGIPSWLHRLRERLSADPRPPRMTELAADVGLHPVYVAREFRRHFGSSISELIHRRRVERAFTALTSTPRATLPEIAYDAGFYDQAHMCRVFKRIAGMTPSALRGVMDVAIVQEKSARSADIRETSNRGTRSCRDGSFGIV